jgi:hypothetical protein
VGALLGDFVDTHTIVGEFPMVPLPTCSSEVMAYDSQMTNDWIAASAGATQQWLHETDRGSEQPLIFGNDDDPPDHHNVLRGASSDRFWTSGPDEGHFANTGARRGALTRSIPDDTGLEFVPWTDDPQSATEVDPLPMSSVSGISDVVMELALTSHPNRAFVHTVLTLIRHGLILGAKGYDASVFRRHPNLKSALDHPRPVRKWLREEVSAGRIYCYSTCPHPRMQIWGLGAVKKRGYDIDEKARVITHFSKDWSDGQASLNNCVDQDESSLIYPRIVNALDDALGMKRSWGSVWAWATDLKSAFRILKMNTSQIHLQGMCFPDDEGQDVYYADAHAGFAN